MTAVVERPPAERAALAALAWETLARAERRTGARSVRAVVQVAGVSSRTGPPPSAVTGSLSPVADSSLAAWSSSRLVASDEVTRASLIITERPPMAVPPALAPLLPEGLRRGGITAVAGSTSLVLALVAHACAQGAWAAVVGCPDLGVLAAAQAGVGLERLAMVPSPGPDAPAVIAALLDGLDVVVAGPGARLTGADRRRLAARARDRGSVLLPTYAWPGAGATLVVEAGRWEGVGAGDGWLRAHRLRVARTGRGVGAGRAVDLVLPFGASAHDEPVTAPAEAGERLRWVG